MDKIEPGDHVHHAPNRPPGRLLTMEGGMRRNGRTFVAQLTPPPRPSPARHAKAPKTEIFMCNYIGYEFGAGTYPDSYCIEGKLHDADSDYLSDEDVPCPICDREGAIQWWFDRWQDMSKPDDARSWEEINAEHLSNATSLVDDIRKNRGYELSGPRLAESPNAPRRGGVSK